MPLRLALLLLACVSCATGRPGPWDGRRWGSGDPGQVLERSPADGRPGDTVELRFRPPHRARARVLHSHDCARTSLTSALRWAAVVQLARSDRGWTLTATDHVQVGEDGAVGRPLTGNDGVVERIPELGEWLGADGVERLVDASEPPGAAPLSGNRRDRLRSHVLSRLAADWNSMVYLWAGRRFELGTTWEAERVVPSPGGSAVRMRSSFAWEGRVPCAPGDLEASCVRLRLRSTPLPESLGAFVLEVLAQDRPPTREVPELLNASVSEEVVVIAEPSTLLPHRFSRSRSIRGVVRVAGEVHRVDSSDTWVRTFEWIDR